MRGLALAICPGCNPDNITRGEMPAEREGMGKGKAFQKSLKHRSKPRHRGVVQSHPHCQVERSLDPSNHQTTHSFYLPISSILR